MKKTLLNGEFGTTLHFERTKCIDDYLLAISKYQVPTQEEEISLLKEYHKTHNIEIRNYLVCCHQRFVYSAAKHYTVDPDLVMELVGEGNLGLIEAIEKFDPENKSNKLMTYAQCYIRRNMNFYINKTNIVRRDSDNKIGTKLETERSLFFNKNGRYPSNDEMRDIMKEKYGVPFVSDYDLEIPSFCSTDVVMQSHFNGGYEEEVISYVDKAMYDNSEFAVNDCENNLDIDDARTMIMSAFEELDDREKDVVMMLFGIGYPAGIDPDDIAKKYGVTRTRIFQIKREAVKKMRYALTA